MLLIRLAPLLIPAVGMAALGFNLLSLIPALEGHILLILFLVLFLAMTVLDREPGWNLALLLGFSFTGGALLNWSGAEVSREVTWLVFLGLLSLALFGAASLGATLKTGLKFLFPLTAFYTLGWVSVLLWDPPSWIQGLLIMVGLALFTAAAASVQQRGFDLGAEDSLVPLGIQLVVILFNLFWLSGLI